MIAVYCVFGESNLHIKSYRMRVLFVGAVLSALCRQNGFLSAGHLKPSFNDSFATEVFQLICIVDIY